MGAAAAYNHHACSGVGGLANPVGGTDGRFDWRGHAVAYTVRGAGSPVLLVHGIHAAASSYEWRANVDALATRHTVYTVDLLGFGRSDRPDVRYHAGLYLSLLEDFAATVVGAPCALVAASLPAAYAIVLGARDPARFPALVLVGPTGLVRLHRPPTAAGAAARRLLDAPLLGTAVFNALVSRESLRTFLTHAYADDRRVTGDMLDAYYATAHQPGARHAPAAFIAGELNVDVRRPLRLLHQPVLLVWGELAALAPVEEIRGFQGLVPTARSLIVPHAGDLPNDERAGVFNDAVLAFLRHAWPTVDVSPPAVPPVRAAS